MTNYQLKKPLIQAGFVLVLFMAFILFAEAAQPAGFWGSIGAVIASSFKTVLLLFGIIVGVLLCTAVLIAIFFGAVALYSVELAQQLYEEFKERVLTVLEETKECCSCSCENSQPQIKVNESDYSALQNSLSIKVKESEAKTAKINSLSSITDEKENTITSLKKELVRANEELEKDNPVRPQRQSSISAR